MVEATVRMGRVDQPVLPFLPAEARSIGPSAGLLEGPEGGVVFVFGLATFTYAAGDGIGRRLAAVQLVATKAASATEVASAFRISTVTLWRWKQDFTTDGVAGLVPTRTGPRGPSKLTDQVSARIVELDAAGASLRKIAMQTGVSTATVRVALGRVTARGAQSEEPVEPTAGAAGQREADTVLDSEQDTAEDVGESDGGNDVWGDAEPDDRPEDRVVDEGGELVVLAAPVARTAERAAARSAVRATGAASTTSSPPSSTTRSSGRSSGSASPQTSLPPSLSPTSSAVSCSESRTVSASRCPAAPAVGSTGSSDCAPRAVTRPSATRTVAVDTPVCIAILRNEAPAASSSTMRALTWSVSFEGPLGPVRVGTSPATPSVVKSCFHRHSVTVEILNAEATSVALAALVATSCTAARRRPIPSPAA